jgi:exodeoxyribonuclease VII large subunit
VIERMEDRGRRRAARPAGQTKARLEGEGLFAADAQAPPAVPAARDRRGHFADRGGDPRHPAPLADRFPSHVLVWPVLVQGQGAAQQVAAAVRGFSDLARMAARCRAPIC